MKCATNYVQFFWLAAMSMQTRKATVRLCFHFGKLFVNLALCTGTVWYPESNASTKKGDTQSQECFTSLADENVTSGGPPQHIHRRLGLQSIQLCTCNKQINNLQALIFRKPQYSKLRGTSITGKSKLHAYELRSLMLIQKGRCSSE